jgi:hypothetical protein
MVQSSLATCHQGLAIAHSLGFGNNLFQLTGPFPQEDMFGMGAAMVMLQQSLQTGRNALNVQFGTIRKLRSAFSNAYLSSAEGQLAIVMVKVEHNKMSYSWRVLFERFLMGMHKQTGDIAK